LLADVADGKTAGIGRRHRPPISLMHPVNSKGNSNKKRYSHAAILIESAEPVSPAPVYNSEIPAELLFPE
jgi:hypothetical protein